MYISFSPGLRDKFRKSDPMPIFARKIISISRVAGHDITPRSTSCRLVYITAYFTALVLLAAYSAALISSLTVYRSNLPFQDLEGILRDRTYKLGVMDKSEMYYTISVSWYFVKISFSGMWHLRVWDMDAGSLFRAESSSRWKNPDYATAGIAVTLAVRSACEVGH